MNKNCYSYTQALFLFAFVTSATFALTGCGKTETKTAASTTKSSSNSNSTKSAPNKPSKTTSTEESATAKFNAYTDAYNKLIGTFGLPQTYERYVFANPAKKRAIDHINFFDGSLDGPLESFKKAKAMQATGFNELDQSAEAIIASLEKLIPQLDGLKIYFESKAYRNDDLARIKAEDVSLRANFAAGTVASEKFNALLTIEQKKRGAAQLAAMKASGDSLGYSTKLALQQGEELVSMFSSENDINNPDKYKAADVLVAELDKTLAEQRQHFAAAKDKKPSPDNGHESVGRYLVQLIGSYRDLKQFKNSKNFNKMVENYNNAITNANRMRS
jgi:Tfp pilus assembly major pilin PilA